VAPSLVGGTLYGCAHHTWEAHMAEHDLSEQEADGRGQLELMLAETEGRATVALRGTSSLLRELKRAQASAATGQLRELRRSVQAAREQWEALGAALEQLTSGDTLDEQAYLSGGGYTKELLAAALTTGLAVLEDDDRLLSYPSVLRVLPADAAIEIDKRRERRLRPSFLVSLLSAAQNRPPRFRPEPFLAALRDAYDLVVSRDGKLAGSVVRLDAVWQVLTMLPGSAKEYGKPEFARDIYLLDQSGVTSTGKDARRLRLAASTGTRGSGVLTTVAVSGQQQRYWGVSFTGADPGAEPDTAT